jgi:hypothetical protein
MANFWESFLNSGPQQLVDPGDQSMPYGPPLWSEPQMPQHPEDMRDSDLPRFELRFGKPAQQVPLWPQRQMPTLGEVMRKYGPPQSDPWFGQQTVEPDPKQGYPSLPYDGRPVPKEPPWPWRPAELRNWDAPPDSQFHSVLYDYYRGRGASHIEALNRADYLAKRAPYVPVVGSVPFAIANGVYAYNHHDPLGIATASIGLIPWGYFAGRARPAFKAMMDRQL